MFVYFAFCISLCWTPLLYNQDFMGSKHLDFSSSFSLGNSFLIKTSMILRELFKWLSFVIQLAIALFLLVALIYVLFLFIIHLIKFTRKTLCVKRIHHVDDSTAGAAIHP